MDLLDIVHRNPDPEPWTEGEKIPWHEPGFSARMLREHLSQSHDAASRRFPIVERQVTWIHQQILGGEPTRVLDLGCGPGLYTSRLANLGHTCTGIDFSPASIDYARAEATRRGLPCSYCLDDIRTADYGTGYGLVMLLFGELNVFRPEDARLILRKAHQALLSGGRLLLEPHTYAAVAQLGTEPASWDASPAGLFSNHPHIFLQENTWHAEQAVATNRYYVIDAESGAVTRHAASTQAYTDDAYRDLIAGCGFTNLTHYPSLIGTAAPDGFGLLALVAEKVAVQG